MSEKNKKIGNLFVIVGQNLSAFDQIYNELNEKHKFSDFDRKIFYAGETSFEKIIEEMDFLPVFCEKKLIVIKNCENLKKSECETLEKIIKKGVVKNTFIIITGADIKAPLKKYAKEFNIFKTPEDILFSQIYKIKRENKERLRSLIKEYITQRERSFQVVIAAAHIYLKNILFKKKRVDEKIIKKFEQLCELDFSLKTGRIHPGEELEIFFYYFFS